MGVSTPLRRMLPVLLLVLCQSVLLLHDTQHIAPDVTHCVACQVHMPQVAETPFGDSLMSLPVLILCGVLPLDETAPASNRPSAQFQPRAPPGNFS